MLTSNNPDLMDEVVRRHQTQIQEAARNARGDRPRSGGIGERPFRVRLGDRLIAMGEAIRGGLPDAPVRRRRELSPHS